MQNTIILTLAVMASLAITSCHRKIHPSKSTQETPSPTRSMTGDKLYASKCGSCHGLYAPSDYNAAEWKLNVDKMQARANINDVEKKLIYDYLVSTK